jgi:hypothetical protein
MEKTDPEHENKQAEVLHFYRDVKILREENESAKEMLTAILSYDESPSIQAISNIYPVNRLMRQIATSPEIMITCVTEHCHWWLE